MTFFVPLSVLAILPCCALTVAFTPGSSENPVYLSACHKARSAQLDTSCFAFAPGSNSDAPFSLSAYQKARAKETSAHLDASRFHFQILFVDDNNFHGRIAEGMLQQIAQYNDALFTLFPSSATIEASSKAPADAAAPEEAVAICEALGLCSAACSEDGTSFNLSYLDQYDLIIALDDEIQHLILRSLPPNSEGYEHKCRSLSEFMSVNFCGVENDDGITPQTIQDMIAPEMWEKAQPYYDAAQVSSSGGDDIFSNSEPADVYNPRLVLSEHGAAIPNRDGWPPVEAAMLVACAGIARFCLDVMDAQFDAEFSRLLERHFHRRKHLDMSIDEADDQLRRGSLSVTGYFSPKERRARISSHLEELASKLDGF